MKKILKRYLHFLLSGFKFYRKRIGGSWYKIREDDVSGLAAPGEYWVQEKPKDTDCNVIVSEKY